MKEMESRYLDCYGDPVFERAVRADGASHRCHLQIKWSLVTSTATVIKMSDVADILGLPFLHLFFLSVWVIVTLLHAC